MKDQRQFWNDDFIQYPILIILYKEKKGTNKCLFFTEGDSAKK